MITPGIWYCNPNLNLLFMKTEDGGSAHICYTFYLPESSGIWKVMTVKIAITESNGPWYFVELYTVVICHYVDRDSFAFAMK